MRSAMIAALALIGVVATAGGAHAEHAFQVDGTLKVGNPATKVGAGVTDRAACNASSPLQGVDGWWIELPSSAAGRPAAMEAAGVDADVWFYDASCVLITPDRAATAYDMARLRTAYETGTIPGGARYAIVDLALGWNAAFTFFYN